MDVVVQQACVSAGVNESAGKNSTRKDGFGCKGQFPDERQKGSLVPLSKVENCSSCSRLSSLLLMVCSVVSITTPRNVIHVVGGVLCFSLVATPSSLQSASICVKVSRQVLVCGGPAMIKLSR